MGIKNTENNLVESFFIQHSLPRFPLSQNHLFDPNITKRAQHFVCVSMRDEFTGQGGRANSKYIQIDSVQECNFFKLLWHYARNINVNFLKNGPDLTRLAQVNIFKEIFIGLPNYPINRSGTNEKGVPSQLDLTSFTIESTGNETNRLTFQIFAKSPNYEIDIYDDVTALFSIHHDDYNASNTLETLKTAHLDGKTAMIMVAQSHSDSATLGINQKVLVDRDNYFATVHILNSSGIILPTEHGSSEINESMYHDHSKWSVNVVYGHEGNFPPLLCFYDLNRSTKQAQRGGGAFCLNSSVTGSSPASLALWELFMSFNPDPNSMSRFQNTDVNVILDKVLPKAVSVSDPGSPIPVSLPPMSGRFTRVSSSKSRRYSIGEAIPTSMIRSAVLSKAEYSDENELIKVLHPETDIPSRVPCPYKFSLASSDVKRNGSIPTKIILNIDKAVNNYGFTKLNQALINYNLQIIPIDDTEQSILQGNNPLQTPSVKRQKSFNSDFTHNTVLVNRKKQKPQHGTPQAQDEFKSSSEPNNTKILSAIRSNIRSSDNTPSWTHSCVKRKSSSSNSSSNRVLPHSSPRTIRRLRSLLNSNKRNRKSLDSRELKLDEGKFMHSALSKTLSAFDAADDSDSAQYENMFNIANNGNWNHSSSKLDSSDNEYGEETSFADD
jgi:hypothetical protein